MNFYSLYWQFSLPTCFTANFSSAKIKNIEATEDAKQKLLDERKRLRDNMPSAFVPTNVAVNFAQHKRCEIYLFIMSLCSQMYNVPFFWQIFVHSFMEV